MNVNDLLASPQVLAMLPSTWGEPLENQYALAEAALIDVRFDAIRSRLFVLFDLKGALHLTTGNTAVLTVEDVVDWSWTSQRRGTVRTWWSVVQWEPTIDQGWSAIIGLSPDGQVSVRGSGASLLVGDVPGGDDAPPDYLTATDEEITHRTAGWRSEMVPLEFQRLERSSL